LLESDARHRARNGKGDPWREEDRRGCPSARAARGIRRKRTGDQGTKESMHRESPVSLEEILLSGVVPGLRALPWIALL